MSLLSESATVGIVGGLIVANLITLFDNNRFLKRLREQHPSTWERLGRPKPHNMEGDQPGDWAAMLYILSGRYLELPDAEMRDLGNRMRLVFGLTIAGMVALSILVGINKMTGT